MQLGTLEKKFYDHVVNWTILTMIFTCISMQILAFLKVKKLNLDFDDPVFRMNEIYSKEQSSTYKIEGMCKERLVFMSFAHPVPQ